MPKYIVRRYGAYRAYADVEVEADDEDGASAAAYEVLYTDLNWILEYMDPEIDGEDIEEILDD